MLKRFAQSKGLVREKDKDPIRKKECGGAPITLDMAVQSRDISVRIVHPGGREELYQNAVSVSQLMEKYPGMWVALPEVFKNPHESFLQPENKLLPGQKYYMIPCTTAQKLKCKHPTKVSIKESAEGKGPAEGKGSAEGKGPAEGKGSVEGKGPAEGKLDMSDARITWEVHEDKLDESIRSAKDFYVSGESWSARPKKRRVKKKKAFVPPLPQTRMFHGYRWEPSLTSVLELSP